MYAATKPSNNIRFAGANYRDDTKAKPAGSVSENLIVLWMQEILFQSIYLFLAF